MKKRVILLAIFFLIQIIISNCQRDFSELISSDENNIRQYGYFLYVGNIGLGEVYIIDTDSNVVVDSLKFDMGGITSMAVTKNGAKLYVSYDKIYAVDLITKQMKIVYEPMPYASLYSAPDGTIFIIYYQNQWMIGTIDTLSDCIVTLDTLDFSVFGDERSNQRLVFNQAKPIIYSVNKDNKIFAYNYLTKKVERVYNNIFNPLHLTISRDGKTMYCTAYANTLVVFNLETDSIDFLTGVNHLAYFALSPDGEYLYITDPRYLSLMPLPSGKISIFQTSTNSYVGYIDVNEASGEAYTVTDRIIILPDGKTAYVTNWYNMLFVIDLQLREVIKTIKFREIQTQVSPMVLGRKQ